MLSLTFVDLMTDGAQQDAVLSIKGPCTQHCIQIDSASYLAGSQHAQQLKKCATKFVVLSYTVPARAWIW